jgi:hypothetical protein
VIPSSVIKATLAPSIAMPNTLLETKGYTEILNSAYGMGRWMASYRGHLLAYHGGDLPGFHSQISCMPTDSIGVIVFVIGDHGAPLYNIISYNVYERFLGMNLTPWNERRLSDVRKSKKAGRESRQKAGSNRVANTKPSHALADFTGVYESPTYGTFTITEKDSGLSFDFHHIVMPLHHFHYDRFDSPDNEEYGLFSLNFYTDPLGTVDRFVTSLDESQVTFVRKVDASLSDVGVLTRYVGKYEQGATVLTFVLSNGKLFLDIPGQPQYELVPYKTAKFRFKSFDDITIEFIMDHGLVTAAKMTDPSGENTAIKKK